MEAPDAIRPWAPRNTLIFFPLHKFRFIKMSFKNSFQGEKADIFEKFMATVAETPSARRVAVNKS
jgi:hypothetical protein